jgi:hypothetical protein
MYDLPIAGTLGNAPRYGLRGPDFQNVDFSLNKDTKARFLGEQGLVQLRAEFFNILNRPNFSNPSAAMSSSTNSPQCSAANSNCELNVQGAAANPALLTPTATAGQITTTANRSRQIQISLKLIF